VIYIVAKAYLLVEALVMAPGSHWPGWRMAFHLDAALAEEMKRLKWGWRSVFHPAGRSALDWASTPGNALIKHA